MTDKEIIQGLEDISELIGCNLFQLDNETETEMLEMGYINSDVSDLEIKLNKAIDMLKKITK